MSVLQHYRQGLNGHALTQRLGKVTRSRGMSLEVSGLHAGIGDICKVISGGSPASGGHVLAEVVGINEKSLTLMPYGSLEGISQGCTVIRKGQEASIGAGPALLGRVIDAFGNPLDGGKPLECMQPQPLKAPPINPMLRPRIERPMETGVRVIDGLLTLGCGQRTGIFAGSGVGKSTLLGLLAQHVKNRRGPQGRPQVNVIALIGERGREVREFIEKQLGREGLAQSVVVVATADQPALTRVRATYAALAVAEYFRDQGADVLLTMDSVTRFAMARREIGLASGEPPTARGYTPSVFAELPQLCERCGTAPSGGSITALFTVLVEGDDMNEPIADSLRAILDGHIVLSRQLAHRGQYPAIDVLKSASRLMPELVGADHLKSAAETIKLMALLERNRQMVEIGAYEKGTNPTLDRALATEPTLQAWLTQDRPGARADETRRSLAAIAPAHAPKEAGP
jgi:flagellum-specific ATP synthase